MLKSPLLISLGLYTLIVGLLLWSKPDFLFHNKKFGVKDQKNTTSLYPLWLILIVIAVVVYACSITLSYR